VPARLFTAATGTAFLTELVYRILIDIINRVLNTAQTIAGQGLDRLSSYFEQRASERRERAELQAKLQASQASSSDGHTDRDGGGGGGGGRNGGQRGRSVLEEVQKLVGQKGPAGVEFGCPMDGRGPPGPPIWVRGVLQGIEEGRMEERDFWVQTHGD
jgi:hypothetical protein